MQVVLLEDVKGSGKKGEVINVSDGYARNFLFPKKLAKVADAATLNEIKVKEAAKKRQEEKERQAAADAAKSLSGKTVRLHARAGESGKLFGAVTTKEISDGLKEQYGVEIDKRAISLDSEIRSFGSFSAHLKLYAGIDATITVVVNE